jgi:hypothetical protein
MARMAVVVAAEIAGHSVHFVVWEGGKEVRGCGEGKQEMEPTTCHLCMTTEQLITCLKLATCTGKCCLFIDLAAISVGDADILTLMAKSEIDDIFASKGKAKVNQPVASSSTAPAKRKRDKKKKPDVEAAKIGNEVTTKKRPAAETIVDPSTRIPGAKRAKLAIPASKKPLKSIKKDSGKGDEDRFKDSRGSGSRKYTLSLSITTPLNFVSRP